MDLKSRIREISQNGVCIAFSGGADSTLLLKMFAEVSTKVIAVTFNTALHPACDVADAKRIAESLGVKHIVIDIDEFADERIMQNPTQRCYYCKKLLFTQLKNFSQENNIPTIIDGTNADDLHEYRPGIKALHELGIISPLAECDITKQQVRQMLWEYGMEVAEKPSSPCMATRLPYNTLITKDIIKRIEQAETYLKSYGYECVRLRVHGDIARIEVPKQDFIKLLASCDIISKQLIGIGFKYITLDLEGFRSGSMDIDIKKGV